MENRDGAQLTRRDLLMMEADRSTTWQLLEPGTKMDAETYFRALSVLDDERLGNTFAPSERVTIDTTGIRTDK